MAVVACWAPGPVLTSPRCAGTRSVVSTPPVPPLSVLPPLAPLPTYLCCQLLTSVAPMPPLSCHHLPLPLVVGGGFARAQLMLHSLPCTPPPGLHSSLPALLPSALWCSPGSLAPLAPVAAAAPTPSAAPEAPTPSAAAGPSAPRSPRCPCLPAPVGRLWPPLLPACRGPGGPGPSPPCPLGPSAGLALGPALRAALRCACGPEPGGSSPTCCPHPGWDPRPCPHPQAGPRLCPLLPTQAPEAGGQPWLH